MDSDSEDEDGFPGTDEITEEEKKRMDSDAGKLEFAKVIREWMRYSKEIKWTTLYDELPKDKDLDMVDDLMQLDLKPLMDHLQAVNKSRKNCFGYLPLMASSSKCQLGALNAQSFSERINSAANLIVTKDKMQLDPVLVDKLVTLRMNQGFMKFVRDNKHRGLINMIPGIEEIVENEDEELWS